MLTSYRPKAICAFVGLFIWLVLGSPSNAAELAGEIRLQAGLNIVGLPVDSAQTPTAADLLANIGPPDQVSELVRHNPVTLQFERCRYLDDGSVEGAGCGLPVANGSGWFVIARDAMTHEYAVDRSCPPLALSPGLNLVALPCAETGLDSHQLLQAVGGPGQVSGLQWLDPNTGRWLTTVYDVNQAAGEAFPLVRGRGYLVFMHERVTQRPPIPETGGDRRAVMIGGRPIALDGSASRDPDTATELLTHHWRLQAPSGGDAPVTGAGQAVASFVPEAMGMYRATLSVSDGVSEVARQASIEVIPPDLGPDTDGDGLSDAAELALGSDPNTFDTDGDGVDDGSEVLAHFTNALAPDSDLDSYSDGEELQIGSDPLDEDDTPFRLLTHVEDSSPVPGEEMVSVTREVIVRLDKPIDPATVNAESVRLMAAGLPVELRLSVSRSEQVITAFHDAPFPASTSIMVLLDGDRLRDRNGFAVDADGDGHPGGTGMLVFETVPLTRIPGTSVSGFIFDANRTGPNGGDVPLAGVRLTVEGLPDLSAVTDETGFFTLEDTPAPEFYVEIDPSGVPAPPGAHYAPIRKPLHSVAGHPVMLQAKGDPFSIYLPLVHESDTAAVTPNQDTTVTFGPQAMDTLEAMFPQIAPEVWELTRVEIPPNSVTFDDGTPATAVTMVPLPTERIPAPVPAGLNPKIVFTVDAGGATNVDGFARLFYPNVDGLAPGETRYIWAFDHDAGKWVTTGTATVRADGLALVSDPGAGVRTLGWRFLAPEPGSMTRHGCFRESLTITNAYRVVRGVTGCVATVFRKVKVWLESVELLVGAAVDIGEEVARLEADIEAGRSRAELAATYRILAGRKNDLVSLAFAAGDTSPVGVACRSVECAQSLIAEASNICKSLEMNPSCKSLKLSTACSILSTGELALNAALTAKLFVEDKFAEGATAAACLGIDFLGGVLFEGEPSASLTGEESGSALTALNDLDLHVSEIMVETENGARFGEESLSLSENVDEIAGSAEDVIRAHDPPGDGYFSIDIPGLTIRGRTGPQGTIEAFLPPDAEFQLTVFDAATARIAEFAGRSSASGRHTSIPLLSFQPVSGMADADGDGIVDAAEHAIGTDPLDADTDMDGLADGLEVRDGLDALDGRAFPTGIIASAPLAGDARAMDLTASTSGGEPETAFVATGVHGLAAVDVSQLALPAVLGQIALPGESVDVAVDPRLDRAAVAAQDGGLHIVDVSDPMAPVIDRTLELGGAVRAVEVFEGIAYAGGDSLTSIDLLSGDVRAAVDLGAPIVDLSRERNRLVAITDTNRLHVVDVAPTIPTVRGAVALPSTAARVFVGDGIAYVANGVVSTATGFPRGGYATVDVREADAPFLISDVDTPSVQAGNLHTVLNGSGLALIAGGSRGLEIHDASDPDQTYAFLTRIPTPGTAQAVAIGNGIAHLADGAAGLHIVNVLAFDSFGIPPVVSIDTTAMDAEPEIAGIQVVEGSTISVFVSAEDDVQLRHVELDVDGDVVQRDPAFPWDFSVDLPALDSGRNSVSARARAVDTGGNVGESAAIELELVEDSVGPTIDSQVPANRGVVETTFLTVILGFSESMDPAGLTAENVFVDSSDGSTLVPFDVQLRSRDRIAQFTYGNVPEGVYRLTVLAENIADRAGNALSGSPLVSTFLVSTAPDADDDGDGLSNAQEFDAGTDPQLHDTDGDGFNDRDEILDGSDPNDGASLPPSLAGPGTGVLAPRFTVANVHDPNVQAGDILGPGFSIHNRASPVRTPERIAFEFTVLNAVDPEVQSGEIRGPDFSVFNVDRPADGPETVLGPSFTVDNAANP